MATQTQKKIISKTTKSTQRYIRLPIDENTNQLLTLVQQDNPFFSDLDSVRYILGKFAKQNNINMNKLKLVKYLDKVKLKHVDTPVMSEVEIFNELKKAGLMN